MTSELTDQDLYEMGWNDVAGSLRRAGREPLKKRTGWAKKVVMGTINLPRSEPEYKRGTLEAAQAFLTKKPLDYKGPAEVVAQMQEKCG